MYKATHLSPMIPSYNLKKTVSFFIDVLGFEMESGGETYYVLQKDGLTLHVQNAGADIGEMSFYLTVDDIEKVWADMKDKVGDLKVRAPFDQQYGMREVHVMVPETKTLMFIGQPIR